MPEFPYKPDPDDNLPAIAEGKYAFQIAHCEIANSPEDLPEFVARVILKNKTAGELNYTIRWPLTHPRDPNKASRKFLFKQFCRQVGVDTRGPLSTEMFQGMAGTVEVVHRSGFVNFSEWKLTAKKAEPPAQETPLGPIPSPAAQDEPPF